MKKITAVFCVFFVYFLNAQEFTPSSTLPLLLNTGTNYSSCASPGTKAITFSVSGLSNLNLTTNQLAQIDLQLNAGGTCGGTNIRDIAAFIKSPAGTCVRIATQFGTTTNYNLANRRLDYSFIQANACLNTIPNYSAFPSSVFSANNVSGRFGYFRTDENIQTAFNGENPNGTWTIYFFTSTTSPACVTDAKLIFGEPTVSDFTTQGNDCANAINWDGTPACLSTTGKTGSTSMPGFSSVTATTSIGGVSCNWNNSRDNDSWLRFVPTSTEVCITLSGLSQDLQSIVVRATSPTSYTSPHPGGPNDTRWELISCPRDAIYAAGTGTTRNHTHCFTAIPCEEYYLVVDGNAGAQSDYFVTGISGITPLPVVECPNDTTVCLSQPAFALSGATPSGGTYSGSGVSGGLFNPAIAGVGTHTITYEFTDCAATNNCTFSITVTLSDSTSENVTSCNPTDVGSVSTTFQNQFNCDSVHTVITTLDLVSTGNETVTDCDSAQVNGVWYFANTTINDTIVGGSQNGCDSVTIYTVVINNTNNTTENVTSCNPADVGSVSTTFQNQFNCDSVHTVVTTLDLVSTGNQTISGCDSLQINGIWYFTNTTVNDTIIGGAQNGCDSVTIYTVVINSGPALTPSTTANTVCGGSSAPCEYSGPVAVINEIMAMPGNTFGTMGGDNTSAAFQSMYNNSNTGEEWIEIYNPNPCSSLDLSCFVLGARTTASNFAAFSFPAGTVVPPLGFIVVGAGSNADINLFDFIGTPNLVGSTRWHLENGCGYVLLANPQGDVVNAVYWSQNNAADLTASTSCGNSFNNALTIPTLCNPAVNPLPAARNIANIEYAGNFGATAQGPANIGRTISRSTDAGSTFVISGIGGTPGACNGVCAPPFSGGGGNCNGTATALPITGSGNYTYLWDAAAGSQTTQTAVELCAGTYCVTVTDVSNNCSQQICIDVSEDLSFDPPLAGVDSSYCEGETLANITATAQSGGALTWYSNSSLTDTIGNGSALMPANQIGTTVYYVTESLNGCESNPSQVSITINITHATSENVTTCNPADVGSVSTTFQNQFNCDSVHTVITTLDLVSSGNQTVTGCDSAQVNGIWYFTNTTVNDTIIGGAQNGCDSVTIFTLIINNSNNTSQNITSCNPADVGSVSTTFQNQFNCDSVHTVITTLDLVSSGNQTVTGCDSAQVNGVWYFANTTVNDTIIGGAQNGCDSVTIFAITINQSITPIFNAVGPFCSGATIPALPVTSNNGITGNWSPTVNNTSTTTYTFTPNAGQCASTANLTININALPSIELDIQDETCEGFNDGIVIATAQEGVAPYSFVLDGITGSDTWNNLSAGTYELTVIDQNNCSSSVEFEIESGLNVSVATISDSEIPLGQSIELTTLVSGSTSGNFIWLPETGLSCTDCDSPVASPLVSTTYQVLYTDVIGCSATDSVLITVVDFADIFCLFPDAFTPNNDNVNDVFRGICEGVENMELRVYNRWGELVYQEKGAYPLNGWNGIFKNREAPKEVYVFYADVTFSDGSQKSFMGNVTLIR